MQMQKNAGFTLIELLVVLVIIMALVAMLLPLLGKVREKARQSTCLSNQRQLCMAMSTYTQDNIDTFPGDLGDTEGTAWKKAMHNSLGNGGVFHCPSLDGSHDQTSYGMNGFLCGVAVGDVKQTAVALLTADAKKDVLLSKDDPDTLRHKDGYLASFADGHVAHLEPNAAVIWGEGDQGTIYSFGAINTPVTFNDDATATCVETGVTEGGVVLLLNAKGSPITAHVTESGGDTPPTTGGLNPATANLQIDTGLGKAFSLHCWTDSTNSNQKVTTTYKFGDDPNAVSLVVAPPPPPQQPGY